MRKQLLLSLGILTFLAIATIMVILYGEGYRFGFGSGHPEILGTGLLVTTSIPDGAEVFVNGHLTTATNNTINLFPGTYTIKIVKDGYFTWQKTMKVQKEVVAKADATLFPTAPQLQSLTQTGVVSPVIDPSMTKVAYTVASQSAKKNGIYVFDLGNRALLGLGGAITQITDETTNILFSNASLSWSPDGKNILATIPATPTHPAAVYLLDATGFNSTPSDVTETLATVTTSWDKISTDLHKSQIATLKKPLGTFADNNWKILAWSEDDTKILYTATTSATIPQIIKPALVGTDSTPEIRSLTPGATYVYDTKEDKNFKIISASDTAPQLNWYADSKHLIYVHDKKIDVMEYDGQNQTTVYAGPFSEPFVFPSPSGSGIVVLTDLNNPQILPNLYSIAFR